MLHALQVSTRGRRPQSAARQWRRHRVLHRDDAVRVLVSTHQGALVEEGYFRLDHLINTGADEVGGRALASVLMMSILASLIMIGLNQTRVPTRGQSALQPHLHLSVTAFQLIVTSVRPRCNLSVSRSTQGAHTRGRLERTANGGRARQRASRRAAAASAVRVDSRLDPYIPRSLQHRSAAFCKRRFNDADKNAPRRRIILPGAYSAVFSKNPIRLRRLQSCKGGVRSTSL